MAKRDPKTPTPTSASPPTAKPDIAVATNRRFGGLRALSGVSPRLTDPLLRKRGFVEARVVRDWRSIIGETYAGSCQPTALKFQKGRRDGGVLELRVISGLAVEIQHRLPLLIERINMHFGWAAVERVKIRQGALPPRRPPSRKHLRPLTPAEREEIAARVTPVADDGLRTGLRLLGEAIRASRPLSRS